MLTRLARFTLRHRKAVLAATALLVVVAGVLGANVADSLTNGGFDDPHSESNHAIDELEHVFGPAARDPNVVVLVTARRGTVDDPTVVDAGNRLTRELRRTPGVASAESYWSLHVTPLRSHDRRQALVVVVVAGNDDEVQGTVGEIAKRFDRAGGVVTTRVGGRSEVFREIDTQIQADLTKAESIAFPVTLVLLILVFGSAVAAGLPLAVGGISIVSTFLVLRIVASVTDVSVFALNMATAMSLGLAIDYSLFIVSRYREELHGGLSPEDAIVRTVETAGKTVAFSAVTVALSLAAALIFPLAFLRSFAYVGIAVGFVTAAGSIVFLPALLAVLGRNVDRFVLWHHEPKPVGEGFWHRVAMVVMRRPALIASSVVVVLVILGIPFFHIAFGLPDDRVLPGHAPSRQVSDELRANFSTNEASALDVVAARVPDAAAKVRPIGDYAAALSRLPGVARVDSRAGLYVAGRRIAPPGVLTRRFEAPNATWLSVVPDESVEAMSPQGEHLVHLVRGAPAPFAVKVGGTSAFLVDAKDALFSRLPLAFAIIAVSIFVLLFLMFGSLLVPFKALVINVLSLSATFGAMVWIFQDGHLSGPLDFTATGTLDTTVPVLMFCVAFGLSMDYEVFLLSRIKEEYDASGDNTSSVAIGLERTGRIVTAAALLISVVMLAFATSSVSFIKLFGLGLAIAVLMDAFVIRATLVPAFMRLAGRANWWAPAPLRRLYERFRISEG
ncbi:MAG: MMPL family transporter [Acidimicrobiia bacterium]